MNAAEFGSKGNSAKSGAFPQVLTVVLGECGSHAIVGAAMGACNGNERALAEQITPRVESDMLVTADRNFYSFALWAEFCRTGADLLWRVNANVELPVLIWLPDGSYLSMAFNPKIRGPRRADLIRHAATATSNRTKDTWSESSNTTSRTDPAADRERSSA